ncbi:hypothetical protein M9H77_36100 [Catharanthus roseus]|uniref:Uncharacterized protein n=1 Tax=Catharanthus roseus TaxID=4058 RepID=A0ACB9ZUK4_CATRO|nr:hypothetical protein M9H77_36100 [Catharanthus roseus]
MKNQKVVLFKTPIMTSLLSHFTPRNTPLIQINAASHLLNPKWKWLGRGKTRLVNIYMFRCNNKMLFVTSSFVGWLIGHILFIIPSPILTKKLKETSKTEEIRVNGKEKTKDEFDFHSTETGYNKSPVYDSYLNRNANKENANQNKKGKLFLLEKSLVTLLFD